MTGRIIHYSEPVEFHKAMPGATSVVIMKRTEKPRKPKSKSRFAGYAGVDEEGFIPNSKRETTMVDYGNDISRGPYHLMLDRQARARQAITGESYAKAFTECYCDPANVAIKEGAQLDHLSKAHDAMHGTKLSMIPAAKAAPPDAVTKSSA
jgi:hypothetical protein